MSTIGPPVTPAFIEKAAEKMNPDFVPGIVPGIGARHGHYDPGS